MLVLRTLLHWSPGFVSVSFEIGVCLILLVVCFYGLEEEVFT